MQKIDCDEEDRQINRILVQLEGLQFQLAALAEHAPYQPSPEKSKDTNNETKMSKARLALEKMQLVQTIAALNTLMEQWQIKKLEKTAKLLERNNTIFAEAEDFVSQAWHVEQQNKQYRYIKFKLKAEEIVRKQLWHQFD